MVPFSLNINRTGAWANGTNNLISFTSFPSADINDFTLENITGAPLGARQSIGGLVLNGNHIALQIDGTSVYWTGLVNNQWTMTPVGGSNRKQTSDNLGTDFINGDDVIFDDKPGTNQTVRIEDGDVATTTTTFNNSTAVSYTITSSSGFGISSGTLLKNGTGTVTLATSNYHGGGTTINAGTLNINDIFALGNGSVTINGGTLGNTSGSAMPCSQTARRTGTATLPLLGRRWDARPRHGHGCGHCGRQWHDSHRHRRWGYADRG